MWTGEFVRMSRAWTITISSSLLHRDKCNPRCSPKAPRHSLGAHGHSAMPPPTPLLLPTQNGAESFTGEIGLAVLLSLFLTYLFFYHVYTMKVGKKRLGFFGSHHYYRFSALPSAALCPQSGLLVLQLSALTISKSKHRQIRFPGCSVKLLTLNLKRNIFRDWLGTCDSASTQGLAERG